MGIAALLLATTLTPGGVAMSLEAPPADRTTIVRAALADADARVRGAAARVVAVTALGGIFRYGLWGHSDLAKAYSAKVLGRGDAALWDAWLTSANDPLDPEIGAIALASANAKIAAATTWYLAKRYADLPPPDPQPLLVALEGAIAARPAADVSESFARELLARELGRKPNERPEWIAFAKSAKDNGVSLYRFADRLTPDEGAASGIKPSTGESTHQSIERIGNAFFTVMTNLPKGVADEVMQATGCNGDWIGFGVVAVDRAARVRDVSLNNVAQTDGCRRALKVLLRTSFATNLASSPPPNFATNDILLVHKGKTDNCFDEGDVVPNGPTEAVRVSPEVTAPKKVRSVEPVYPETERVARISGIVIIELHINTHGCVEAMQILKPLTPALNSAALVALSQWRFTPGIIDGKPVDVLYNLTLNFKLK
jgi:TonB family protein